ncbi:MAG: hypothetical protein ACOX6S_08310 [Clostridia bacterium]
MDPPRKGCDETVLDAIVKSGPSRIIYVSCNPSTLARDLAFLNRHGYSAKEIQPVDMFPHTDAIKNGLKTSIPSTRTMLSVSS